METINSLPTIGSDSGEMQQGELFQTSNSERDTHNQTGKKRNAIKSWKRSACPPRGWPIKYLTWGLVLASFLGALWSVFPDYMKLGKSFFGLVVTILLSIAAEKLIVKIPTPPRFPPIPPLLASLLMGLMLRNLPYPGNIAEPISPSVSSIFRTLALIVIITRAGLEIEPKAMQKVKWAVIRLAFMPCIVETCCIGIFANLILKIDYIWSFMMGFVIAAVSPAVVVPSLTLLQKEGYGVEKGVPSLVMAASGIDDVLAITGFTILLELALPSKDGCNFFCKIEELFNPSETSTAEEVTTSSSFNSSAYSTLATSFENFTGSTTTHSHSPDIGEEIGIAVLEVVLGIISGLILGFLISYLPHNKMKYKTFCRGFLLLSIGTFMVFATEHWEIPAAGTLCSLVMSFTASMKWKEKAKPLAHAWEHMWSVFQPILFGLTGALIDVEELESKIDLATTVGLGLAVLAIALIGRLMTSTLVTIGLKYNIKEKIFVSISWIPKGTVQAALGSAAMERASMQGKCGNEYIWGTKILVLAVLITLITAPLGSFGISFAGPRLLSLTAHSDVESVANNSEEKSICRKKEKDFNSIGSFDSGVDLKGFGSSNPEEAGSLSKVNYSYQHDRETEISTIF